MTKEEKIKFLEETLTKFKKRKPFLRILNLFMVIFIAFFEGSYMMSLATAFMQSSILGIIVYFAFVLIGIWLGVTFLRQFLNIDLVEKVLKNAIEETKRGY